MIQRNPRQLHKTLFLIRHFSESVDRERCFEVIDSNSGSSNNAKTGPSNPNKSKRKRRNPGADQYLNAQAQ